MAHGLDVVVRAARQLKAAGRDDVAFWIVGDGAERSRLEAECRAEGLDHVVFTGLVSKAKIAEVIASSDACLVHLRKTELFETVIPSKIFEIMAMNVPIIMGVRGQAQRIVLAAQAGLAMTPEDEDSLLAGIETIAGNRSAYCRGRDYVARHFDRDVLAQRLLGEIVAMVAPTPATIPFPAPAIAEPAQLPLGDTSREAASDRARQPDNPRRGDFSRNVHRIRGGRPSSPRSHGAFGWIQSRPNPSCLKVSRPIPNQSRPDCRAGSAHRIDTDRWDSRRSVQFAAPPLY